jgi:alpha,alpha-trehalose phosphorylase
MAAFMDLDDRNGTASEGLHLATMGGLWQALVMGFAGIRPSGEALAIDPRLPPGWDLLEVPVRFRGRRVRVVLGPGSLTIRSSAPLDADIPGVGRVRVDHGRVELRERSGRWAAAA